MKRIAAAALLAAIALWWWWPAPARERIVRGDPAEAMAARESGRAPDTPESPLPELPARSSGEDVPDKGDCSLEIHLQDAETREPVAGVVSIYRLDAPGSEHWTRGDQLQAKVIVPVGGTTVEGLPAGFYRPHCLSQRYPPVDSESFEVAGRLTKRVIPVPMPRSFDAWLVVRDENGRPLEYGDLTGVSLGSSMRPSKPQWLRPRLSRETGIIVGIGGGAGGSFGRSGTRRLRAFGPDGRYRLNAYAEDDCRLHRRVLWRWRSADRSEVRALLDLERWREATFFGVSVPLEPIREAVLLPSGQRAVEAGAEISAWCDARSDESPDEIEVQVKLEGYEDLQYVFAAGEEPPVRTMVPKP